jgi:hypothetical protein
MDERRIAGVDHVVRTARQTLKIVNDSAPSKDANIAFDQDWRKTRTEAAVFTVSRSCNQVHAHHAEAAVEGEG